jgi:hypothetical protein
MRERQHVYEDLNKSASANPGGSQQLEIPSSLNSKRAASFFQSRWFSPGAGILTPAKILSSAGFSAMHQYFVNLPDFFKSAKISQIRLIFVKAPIFFKSAWFFEKRQYFSNPPDFLESTNISQIRLIFRKAQWFWKFAWFFLAANICIYFQYLFLH